MKIPNGATISLGDSPAMGPVQIELGQPHYGLPPVVPKLKRCCRWSYIRIRPVRRPVYRLYRYIKVMICGILRVR